MAFSADQSGDCGAWPLILNGINRSFEQFRSIMSWDDNGNLNHLKKYQLFFEPHHPKKN